MADIAQIQIIPVEDGGYFIQVINADGSGQKNPRHVAINREDLVVKIKALADGLFTKEPPPPPMQAGPVRPPLPPGTAAAAAESPSPSGTP